MRICLEILRNEDAAIAVEYAVMLALVLLGVISTIAAFGQMSGGMWGGIIEDLEEAGFFN